MKLCGFYGVGFFPLYQYLHHDTMGSRAVLFGGYLDLEFGRDLILGSGDGEPTYTGRLYRSWGSITLRPRINSAGIFLYVAVLELTSAPLVVLHS